MHGEQKKKKIEACQLPGTRGALPVLTPGAATTGTEGEAGGRGAYTMPCRPPCGRPGTWPVTRTIAVSTYKTRKKSDERRQRDGI